VHTLPQVDKSFDWAGFGEPTCLLSIFFLKTEASGVAWNVREEKHHTYMWREQAIIE